MNDFDVVVIGAGISGMSFAHYARKAGMNVLVLEKGTMPGGSFHSANIPDDFWLELGAHTCYNSYGNLIGIIEDCGMMDDIIPRAKVPFKLLAGNKVKSFISAINIFELLISLPKAITKKRRGETVESYYGSILGKKNFKRVFSSLFGAVPSQNADEFPADALFKKRPRRKDVLKSFTMKNGLQSIIRGITAQQGIAIKKMARIHVIDQKEGGYSVQTDDEEFISPRLAVCTSVSEVPMLIGKIAPDAAELITGIHYVKVESFGVMIPKDASPLKPFAGLVPLNEDFYSVVSRDTVPHDKYRGFTFHFKPDVLDKAQKISKVCEVLHIEESKIVAILEKTNIVPALRPGHYELMAAIDQHLEGRQLFVSGNYFDGLAIEDCVSRSKAEADRMVKMK